MTATTVDRQARAAKAHETRRATIDAYETPFETHWIQGDLVEYRIDKAPGVGVEVRLTAFGYPQTTKNPRGIRRKLWWLSKGDPRLGDPVGLHQTMKGYMG